MVKSSRRKIKIKVRARQWTPQRIEIEKFYLKCQYSPVGMNKYLLRNYITEEDVKKCGKTMEEYRIDHNITDLDTGTNMGFPWKNSEFW